MVKETRLAETFKLHPGRLARYCCTIEAGYRAVPFHNATHAASVLRAMQLFVSRAGMVAEGGYCDPLTHLAVLLAAIIHDYEHLGLNNDFLCSSRHPIAQRYNDRYAWVWAGWDCRL